MPRDSNGFCSLWEDEILMAATTQIPESQFAYVMLVARRARQLMSGAMPLMENPRVRKPTRMAEEEVQKGLIEYEM